MAHAQAYFRSPSLMVETSAHVFDVNISALLQSTNLQHTIICLNSALCMNVKSTHR